MSDFRQAKQAATGAAQLLRSLRQELQDHGWGPLCVERQLMTKVSGQIELLQEFCAGNEPLFLALDYCAEQIERRGWKKWSEGASVSIHDRSYHVTVIVDPEADPDLRRCKGCGQPLQEFDLIHCVGCAPAREAAGEPEKATGDKQGTKRLVG